MDAFAVRDVAAVRDGVIAGQIADTTLCHAKAVAAHLEIAVRLTGKVAISDTRLSRPRQRASVNARIRTSVQSSVVLTRVGGASVVSCFANPDAAAITLGGVLGQRSASANARAAPNQENAHDPSELRHTHMVARRAPSCKTPAYIGRCPLKNGQQN